MNHSSRRRILAAAGALAAVAFGGALPAQAADIKPRLIRFGYGLAENSNQGRAVKVFADEVARLSGGKMKVRAIGGAALGPDTQMQQALIGGAQEMMVGSTATLVGIAKEMALWDTPFLVNNVREADALLDGPVGDKVRGKLADKGMVGLVYWENGFRNLTNSKRAVNRLEDLDGIKLRVMQNNVFLDSFKQLGANAVPLPYSELFSALVSGFDVRRGKPDPEVFLLAADRLGLPPGRCVVIEDAPAGIEAARRAGMRAIALSSSHAREELGGAHRIIDTLRALLEPGALSPSS